MPPSIWGLTAAWAFSESAVGGVMHGLGLPLTGMTVGGFAVASLAAMAAVVRAEREQGRRAPWGWLLQATLLVVAAKAIASPHTPATAYVAVAFQGLAAWCFYRFVPWHAVATVGFAVVAMTESATQKALMLTWVYGEAFWTAVDALGASAARQLPGDAPGSRWLIGVYVGLYAAWGALLGLGLGRWPRRWQAQREQVRAAWESWEPVPKEQGEEQGAGRGAGRRAGWRRAKWVGGYVVMTGIVVGGLAWMGREPAELGALLLRSVAATLFLFVLVGPAIRWGVNRWARRGGRPAAAWSLLATSEEQGERLRCCWALAASGRGGEPGHGGEPGRRGAGGRGGRWGAGWRALEYWLILSVEVPTGKPPAP
jgi:hypothetical protein